MSASENPNHKSPTSSKKHSPQIVGPSSLESDYDERGVDRSLIRWMLSLSPEERLESLQNALALLPEDAWLRR